MLRQGYHPDEAIMVLARAPAGLRSAFLVARLGRSPDRGDAVVMAFTRGQDNAGWQATDADLDRPKVNRGHENKRRR